MVGIIGFRIYKVDISNLRKPIGYRVKLGKM